MLDYRRSYRKTAIAAALGAGSGAIVLAICARATLGAHSLPLWAWLAWFALGLVGLVVLVSFGLVLAGGMISLHRDALEAAGVSYAPGRPRERPSRPVRRAARALLPVLSRPEAALGLKPGDDAEVRSLDEILATLDDRGMRDGLPFMPEMAAYCGKRFRTFRRVDKLNDWVDHTGLRRARNTVLLEGLHCDGSGHGGCQAWCHLRWNEAWLRRPAATRASHAQGTTDAERNDEQLAELARLARRTGEDGAERWVCQVTELGKGTTPLHPADPRHYLGDLWRGNVGLRPLLEGVSIATFNWVQRKRKGVAFPVIVPAAPPKTPDVKLGIAEGERVRVRSKAEIEQTLNARFRNRGLWFDQEMLRFCGGEYRVASRVSRLIEERSGAMIELSTPCIILEGVTASAEYQGFGAQNEAIFWREAWLTRAPRDGDTTPA